MLHELLPLDAELNAPLNELTVTMDGEMDTEVGLDTDNWSLTWGDVVYTIDSVATDGPEVSIGVTSTLVPAAPNGISFAPPPFDVRGTDGGFAAAFADFPVHL